MTQSMNDDAFSAYFSQKLLPFLKKYKALLLLAVSAVIILFIVMGTVNVLNKEKQEELSNMIYTTLKGKEEITAEDLEKLAAECGTNEAALEVQWRLAGTYVEEQNYEKAGEIYRTIMTSYEEKPVSLYALMALGTILQDTDQHAEALSLYTQGIERYSTKPRIRLYFLLEQAKTQVFMGEFSAADDSAAEAQALLQTLPDEDADPSFDQGIADQLTYLQNQIVINKK